MESRRAKPHGGSGSRISLPDLEPLMRTAVSDKTDKRGVNARVQHVYRRIKVGSLSSVLFALSTHTSAAQQKLAFHRPSSHEGVLVESDPYPQSFSNILPWLKEESDPKVQEEVRLVD